MENRFDKAEWQFYLNGINVYSDINLTKIVTETVKLPLWVRLTSWPWRPFKAYYEIKLTVADDKVYKWEVNGETRFVAHPHTVREMSRMIFDSTNLDVPEEN